MKFMNYSRVLLAKATPSGFVDNAEVSLRRVGVANEESVAYYTDVGKRHSDGNGHLTRGPVCPG